MNFCRRCKKFVQTIVPNSFYSKYDVFMMCCAVRYSYMYKECFFVHDEKEWSKVYENILVEFERKMHEMVCDGGEGCLFKTEHLMEEWNR